MPKLTRRQVAYLVRSRVERAQRALDNGQLKAAQESTRRSGQYVRVLESMTSDPDLLQRCQSLDELLRNALQAQKLQDEAAEDYLDFALAESGVVLRSLGDS